MDSFKTTVILIALIILILFLIWIGTTIQSSAKNAVYPPVQNPCPDHWTSDASGNCFIPTDQTNTGNITNFADTNPKTYGYDPSHLLINFADDNWNAGGISAQCNQRAWAIGNQIQWDTITNYNQC
jgi:hypothetical protein